MPQEASRRPQEGRLPLTCLQCWERDRENIDLIRTGEHHDNRAVETTVFLACPVCGWRSEYRA